MKILLERPPIMLVVHLECTREMPIIIGHPPLEPERYTFKTSMQYNGEFLEWDADKRAESLHRTFAGTGRKVVGYEYPVMTYETVKL